MKFRKTLKLGIAAAAICVVSGNGYGQERQMPMTVHPIKEGKLYWVEGPSGGNSGVIIGDTGVVVIDVKTTPEAGAQLVAAIAKLTPKPITHVIETHSDGDHIGGIVSFPQDIKIIGHINNKNEQRAVLAYATPIPGGGKCAPDPDRLPNMLIYKDKVSATLDGEHFVFHYFGPSHTNGDLIVELPDYKLAFTGDIITTTAPIHPEKSGSLAGWFHTAQQLLAMNVTTYVGGHASTTDTKDSLRSKVAERQVVRDKIDALVAQGKTESDIKTMFGKEAAATVGCSGVPRPSQIMEEYNEKTDKAQEIK
ncbi:MAG TPA: MBL fold metallo-hydrolase [Rhizomicrobium sp.]|jgi:glyoxylase-like metal-dependent hydrolase (beta-lactamase superfamily II)